MSTPPKQPATNLETKKNASTGKLEPEFLVKSGWPKTPKETIKMMLNFLVNFL